MISKRPQHPSHADADSRSCGHRYLIRPRSPEAFTNDDPERHRIIFYLGHLEAFDWNLLSQAAGVHQSLRIRHLFAFGLTEARTTQQDERSIGRRSQRSNNTTVAFGKHSMIFRTRYGTDAFHRTGASADARRDLCLSPPCPSMTRSISRRWRQSTERIAHSSDA